jgi:TfoX/Sxy family transcriptional regulator of competence genes
MPVAYDDELAERVREVIGAEPGMTEKRMFGGLGFLVYGNLAVSASSQGGLLVRVDPNDDESLTSQPHVGRAEMRGREMAGWLRVGAEAVTDDDALRRWVDTGVTYARSLPAK